MSVFACAEERTYPRKQEKELTQTELDTILLNIETERFRD